MFDGRDAVRAFLRRELGVRARVFQSRAATVLLMSDADGPLLEAAVEGLVSGDFVVDDQFLSEVYWSSPPRTRPDLGGLGVVSFLPPACFRQIWRDALKSCRGGAQRAQLAERLSGFLNRNPGQADTFARQIRAFCRERNHVARRTGILLLATLSAPRSSDFSVVSRSLAGSNADDRLAALGAIQKWAVRGRRASASARAFIRATATAAQVERARADRDELIRMAAAHCRRMLGIDGTSHGGTLRETSDATRVRASRRLGRSSKRRS